MARADLDERRSPRQAVVMPELECRQTRAAVKPIVMAGVVAVSILRYQAMEWLRGIRLGIHSIEKPLSSAEHARMRRRRRVMATRNEIKGAN
jgi:hypothetical protein